MALRARKLKELMADAEVANGNVDDAGRSLTEAPPAAPAVLDRPVNVSDGDIAAFMQEHPNVLLDCWAPWCGPCRVVGPIIEELAGSREFKGQVAFAKLNVDENPMTSRNFAIQSIPTLLAFRNGRLIDRLVGALPKAQLSVALRRLFRVGTPGSRR